LAPDEILTLRFRGGTSEVPVRLVGEMGGDARRYIYGVAFVDPGFKSLSKNQWRTKRCRRRRQPP
jgi:hypothetical protein